MFRLWVCLFTGKARIHTHTEYLHTWVSLICKLINSSYCMYIIWTHLLHNNPLGLSISKGSSSSANTTTTTTTPRLPLPIHHQCGKTTFCTSSVLYICSCTQIPLLLATKLPPFAKSLQLSELSSTVHSNTYIYIFVYTSVQANPYNENMHNEPPVALNWYLSNLRRLMFTCNENIFNIGNLMINTSERQPRHHRLIIRKRKNRRIFCKAPSNLQWFSLSKHVHSTPKGFNL